MIICNIQVLREMEEDNNCYDWEDGSGLLIQEKSCNGKQDMLVFSGSSQFAMWLFLYFIEGLEQGSQVMDYFTMDQIPFFTSMFINILLLNIIISFVVYHRYY